ncbi:hypothetical protein IWQ61_001554 [Dispira simplex]|nr:hypothetical protein IWQ61_001554 [Dispira simplex]
MKNLVFIFGILSVVLLQTTALPGSSSSTDPDNGDLEDLINKNFAEHDGFYDSVVEQVRKDVHASSDLFDPNPPIQLKSWCGDMLNGLTDKEKESKMDLFVQALCVVNDHDVSVRRLLAAVTKLPPKNLVLYVADMLKRWGYVVHKDYQAVLGQKDCSDEDVQDCSDEDIQDLEGWYLVPPYSMKASRETDRTLHQFLHRSNLQFPKGHFSKDVHPMLDERFQVKWVNISKITDLELLRFSPYLLLLKHGESPEMQYFFIYVWGVLRQNDLLKGPGSILEPVVNSYPFYFHTDLDIFGNSVDQLTSVWNMNFDLLRDITSVHFSLAISLLCGKYEKLEKNLELLTRNFGHITNQAKKEIALVLYSMAQHIFTHVQNKVDDVLTKFLDEPDFQQMKDSFPMERERETSQVFERGSVKMLRDSVRVRNGQVEVAMVDILPSA